MPRPIEIRTVVIDSNYTKAERDQIGRLILDHIIRRTKSGKSETKSGFVGTTGGNKYSPNYTKTGEFKGFGKRPTPINLSLSGRMLRAVTVLDTNIPGRISYGFKSGDNNDKASYVSEKGYRFLGLTTSELQDILKKFGIPSKSTIDNLTSGISSELVRRIFGT